jgi:hypothetical protein
VNKLIFPGIVYIAFIIVTLAVLSSCITPSSFVSQTLTETEVEDEMYRLVNEERESTGQAALLRDPVLDTLARQYSAGGFSREAEQSSDIHYLYCNSWRVIYSNGSPKLTEDTARDQVDYCLESYDLRNAIFRSDARATGIGVAILDNAIYYTQVFDVLNTEFGDGDLVSLHENDLAVDPSWEQLRRFVMNDDTDEYLYREGSFVCTDFAAMLHDRAEATGIRAAYVSVDFATGPGHALNAVNTTDRGLVYIDCTGPGLNVMTSGGAVGGSSIPTGYDKVAYLSTAGEYGILGIDRATSFDYAFYEQWLEQWEAYQTDIGLYEQKRKAYEEAVGGREIITDPDEYAMLQSMSEELQALRGKLETWEDKLGNYRWESLGTVMDFYVHW